MRLSDYGLSVDQEAGYARIVVDEQECRCADMEIRQYPTVELWVDVGEWTLRRRIKQDHWEPSIQRAIDETAAKYRCDVIDLRD